MVRRFRILVILSAALCLFVVASRARAQSQIGLVGGLGSANKTTIEGVTLIDLIRGASQTGTYSTATIFWAGGSGGACASSFTLKFYRPDAGGTNLTYLTERGPFDSQARFLDLVLSPPVALEQNDVVGVTELAAAPCGGVALVAGGADQTLAFNGDSGTASISVCNQSGADLIPQTLGLIVRTTGSDIRAGVVLGAGSAQGAAGSNFRTSLQLANPGIQTIQGRLIFHPIGLPGLNTDPSLSYSLAPTRVVSFDDIVSAIGTTGLGSIDVIATSSYAPLVTTRIFNDGGAAGTSGFTEPLVRSGDEFVIGTGDSAWLVAPSDFTKFRMNIAVRSLVNGATLSIQIFGPDGSLVGTVTKTYLPDVFDLQPVSTYFGSLAVPANGLVQVSVTAGKAIVGGVTVDQTTNDTGLQLGNRLHF